MAIATQITLHISEGAGIVVLLAAAMLTYGMVFFGKGRS